MNDTDARASARLARDSAVVGAATIASRLLGFARDVLIARLLGAGPVADAFLAALRLPNLVRRILGEGGLNAPFVPLYLSIRQTEGEAAARRFAGEATAQITALLLAIVALGQVFAPWLVLGLAGGFAEAPDTLALASLYTRLMLPYLALTTVAAVLAALLNAERRFAVAALAPAAMNAVLVAVLLAALLQGIDAPVAAPWLALAVTATGLVHLAMVGAALRRIGGVRLRLRWSPAMTRLVRTGGATLLAASSAQLLLLVSTQIASAEPGAVAALYYADRVFQLPLGFVGVAMGTVALSEMAASRDGDAGLAQALRLGLALAFPAAIALWLLAEPIVSVLFEYGRFGADDRASTAGALAAFALGLPFGFAGKVLAQVYFVRTAPRLPLIACFAALASAIAAGLALPHGGEPARLAALAASLGFAVNALLLAGALARAGVLRLSAATLRPLTGIAAACLVLATLLVALLPAFAPWLAVGQPALLRLSALGGLCLAGLCAYAACGWLFGLFRR